MLPLTRAVRAGDLAETLRVLRAGGAGDVDGERDDDQQWTPLFWAARDGHVAIASALLGCGASPLAKDVDGRTPLDYARAAGRADVTHVLEALVAPRKAKRRPSPTKRRPNPGPVGATRFLARIESPSAMRYRVELPAALAKEVGSRVRVAIAGGAPRRLPVDTKGTKRFVRLLPAMLDAAGIDEGDRVEIEVAPTT